MLDQRQIEELERILKEIGTRLYGVRYSFYYKKRNEELGGLELVEGSYRYVKDILFSPDLEYALYVEFAEHIRPSCGCLKFFDFASVVSQFVPIMRSTYDYMVSGHMVSKEFVEDVIGIRPPDNRDPLFQIFEYGHILSHQWLQHVYVCLDVFYVIPDDPDPSSIFHGKRGVVAYCMSFRDLILTAIYEGGRKFYTSFGEIRHAVLEKIRDDDKLKELWNQDKMKACDVNFVKSLMRDEIEKFNSLMRQNGITRIVLSLD